MREHVYGSLSGTMDVVAVNSSRLNDSPTASNLNQLKESLTLLNTDLRTSLTATSRFLPIEPEVVPNDGKVADHVQKQSDLLQKYKDKLDEVWSYWQGEVQRLTQHIDNLNKSFEAYDNEIREGIQNYNSIRNYVAHNAYRTDSKLNAYIRLRHPDLYALLNFDENLDDDEDTDSE